LPALRSEDLAVGGIHLLSNREAELAMQLDRKHRIGSGIPTRDEHRRHRRDVHRLTGGHPTFESPHVGVGRLEVMGFGEKQRHVDPHAGDDRFLHRRQSWCCPRDLD
jgi:hypothetical protein